MSLDTRTMMTPPKHLLITTPQNSHRHTIQSANFHGRDTINLPVNLALEGTSNSLYTALLSLVRSLFLRCLRRILDSSADSRVFHPSTRARRIFLSGSKTSLFCRQDKEMGGMWKSGWRKTPEEKWAYRTKYESGTQSENRIGKDHSNEFLCTSSEH